jgi:Raf kinase inhibitor-like YbhB/YbcL family protein
MPIQLYSEAFAPNDPIPRKYTGDGEDVSPRLKWSGVPEGAKALALIVEDPDAPRPVPWLHWTIYGIPADATELRENVPKEPTLTIPVAARQGVNDFGMVGYGGPAPPRGHGVHRYHFRLYALDATLIVAARADLAALRDAMRGHVIEETDLVGTYERR